MDGTVGEIRMFGGNFAPENWLFCQGQVLPIFEYEVLFSLIGTTYGGDGQTSFALPNLAGHIPIGTGQGAGLPNYVLGEQVGVETVTLNITQIPEHTHVASVQPSGGGGSASATLYGVNSPGGQLSPAGNYVGQDTAIGATPYATGGDPVAMHADAVSIGVDAPGLSITVTAVGASESHNNIQPILAVNYIICLVGEYPLRS